MLHYSLTSSFGSWTHYMCSYVMWTWYDNIWCVHMNASSWVFVALFCFYFKYYKVFHSFCKGCLSLKQIIEGSIHWTERTWTLTPSPRLSVHREQAPPREHPVYSHHRNTQPSVPPTMGTSSVTQSILHTLSRPLMIWRPEQASVRTRLWNIYKDCCFVVES